MTTLFRNPTKIQEAKALVNIFNEGAQVLKERLEKSGKLTESFKEDWNMTNGSSFTTTKIASKIWSKHYDMFEKYYEVVDMWTPADLGMPEGAGAYKISKIKNTVAGKLAPGEKVTYYNADAGSVTIETDTYGTGLMIDRRSLKRYAPGVIQRLLDSASDGVHRSICTYIANAFVSGAASGNTVTGGISLSTIADAQLNVTTATDTNGIKLGVVPNYLILSSTGKNVLVKTSDWKTISANWAISRPGQFENTPLVYDGMKVIVWELISATKGGAVVHGMVVAGGNSLASYFAMVFETGMDVYEGRVPGTAGDWEYIFAIDAGYAVLSDNFCSVITA